MESFQCKFVLASVLLSTRKPSPVVAEPVFEIVALSGWVTVTLDVTAPLRRVSVFALTSKLPVIPRTLNYSQMPQCLELIAEGRRFVT